MIFDTDLNHDKWVPSTCLTIASILLAIAYILFNIHFSAASDVTTLEGEEEILLTTTSTIENIKKRYVGINSQDFSFEEKLRINGERTGNIKILLVPGHDEEFPGAVYGDITEQEVNLQLAEELERFLKEENAVSVYITRDQYGYKHEFEEYFEDNVDKINQFRSTYKALNQEKIWSGEIEEIQTVDHDTVPGEVAYRLYGINKWANDNEIDIIIHIHFNDYPNRPSTGGKYNGFSIYIPQRSYRNHDSSLHIASKVRETLNDFVFESNLPLEKDIIIEDTQLIAVGASNTLDGASILVEYSYIYEPQIVNRRSREIVLREMAYKTYLGLKDVFTGIPSSSFGISSIIPEEFSHSLEEGTGKRKEVIELQNILSILGYYPEGCPITGYFGVCTKDSLINFQGVYDLSETGIVDYKTANLLEEIVENY